MTYTQETTNTITRQAITWNSPGKRRRGRPRNTWQRYTEKETKEMGYTRREMEKMAPERKRWRSLVDGLCSQRANRHKYMSRFTYILLNIHLVLISDVLFDAATFVMRTSHFLSTPRRSLQNKLLRSARNVIV